MLKTLLCVLTITVSIRVAVCDFECFIKKLDNPDYENTLAGIDQACTNYPFVLKSLRENVKICEVSKISFDGVESFFRDFCKPDSSINQNFINRQQCLIEKFGTLTCMPSVLAGNTVEAWKDECKKRGDIERCILNGAGKPCDAEEFTTSAVMALESFYEGVCKEAGGAAANKVTLWSVLLCIGLFLVKWQWS